MRSTRNIMRNIAHDDTLDPHNVTKAKLKAIGLTPEQIDEVLKLQHIYEELEDNKPVDTKQLVKELEDVAKEIKDSAEQSRLENIEKDDKDFENKMNGVSKLGSLLSVIDHRGNDNKLFSTEKDKIKKSIRNVMIDISHKNNIDPSKVTRKDLEKMNLSPDEIDEI